MRRELDKVAKLFSTLFNHRVLDRIAVHIAEICKQLEGEGPKASFVATLSDADRVQFCTEFSRIMLQALDIGQQVQQVCTQFNDFRISIEKKLPPLSDNEIALAAPNAFQTDLAAYDED